MRASQCPRRHNTCHFLSPRWETGSGCTRPGSWGGVGKAYRPLTDLEMELTRTKKELAEEKMERDIVPLIMSRAAGPVLCPSEAWPPVCGSLRCSLRTWR